MQELDHTVELPNKPILKEYGIFKIYSPLSHMSYECLKGVYEWYNPENVQNVLLPVVTATWKISLRLLDWLVTNYTKRFPTWIVNLKQPNSNAFNVNNEYLRMRAQWTRILFDPFRRQSRYDNTIYFTINGLNYKSTVAQLNFIKWVVKTRVYDYAYRDKLVIRKHMKNAIERNKASRKLAKSLGLVYKRTALSNPPKPSCFIHMRKYDAKI